MKIINWSAEYSVGVAQLDQQHQKIIDLINELADCLCTDEEMATASRVLNEMHNYIIDHFGLEERMLSSAKYPQLAEHKEGHNRFIKKFSHLCAEVDSDRSEAVPHLLAYLNDWWDGHILHEDMKYSPLLAKK
ncbi:MAG: hemerythrin family protein [Gammaproteobacteria bacterium]|nr:hemerythrin family protein [Gammaproteobacteria bacterium]